jgi:hypothetical protein
MNVDNFICLLNSFFGIVATIGLLYLQYAGIVFNQNAWFILLFAAVGNFMLFCWLYHKRPKRLKYE